MKTTKRLCCLLATGLIAANCLSLNAFAWEASISEDILDRACYVLKSDGKEEVNKFYKNIEPTEPIMPFEPSEPFEPTDPDEYPEIRGIPADMSGNYLRDCGYSLKDRIKYRNDVIKYHIKYKAYKRKCKAYEKKCKAMESSFVSGYDNFKSKTIEPKRKEAIPGTHRYICEGEPSTIGQYYKNKNEQYSISARTRFEEHYSAAINLYKNGNKSASFDSLGKAIHYLCDIGCPTHTCQVKQNIVNDFDKFSVKEYKYLVYPIKSASELYEHVLHSDIGTILNELGKATCKYKPYLEKGDFKYALEETIPITQQYVSAILNKFYVESQDPSTNYIKEDEKYFINMVDSDMCLETTNDFLQISKKSDNNDQKFLIDSLNDDGEFYIYPSTTSSERNSGKFKLISNSDGTVRIVSTKQSSNYDYVLGVSKTDNKTIELQEFSPEDKTQKFTFIPVE